MRRVLRGVAEGEDDLGTSTLADPSVVDDLQERSAARASANCESPQNRGGASRLRPDPCSTGRSGPRGALGQSTCTQRETIPSKS